MLPRRYWYVAILFACTAALIQSCGSAPVQVTNQAATNTSFWPSLAPAQTDTPPTPTNEITATSVTGAPTMTVSPSPTDSPTRTPAVKATHAFPTPAGSFSEIPSPDGKWVVFVRSKDLKVIQAGGSPTWTLDYKQWTANYLRVMSWSGDGRYLYFLAQRFVREGIVAFVDGFTLERLELDSGKIKEILPAAFYTYSISISPDSSLLAYIFQGKDPMEVHLLNLNSGDEEVVKLERGQLFGGKMLWSVDQKTLVFTAANADKNPLYSLVKIDVSSASGSVLVKSDRRFLTPTRWGPDGRVLVTEQNRAYWWLDLKTGILEAVKETPVP